MLINAYVNDSRERGTPRRSGGTSRTSRRATTRGASRPRARWRPRSRPTSSTPCSPTAPGTTSTTPIPSCRRPSAPTPARSSCYDKAAERILQRVDGGRRRALPAGQEIVVYKNNSDGKGNSYGCHENYLMDRACRSVAIVAHVMPHFVTRQIFTGAGKVGCEAPGRRRRRGAVPAHAAGRLLRGGGRARDHVEAADRQHPRRAALRRAEVPAPPRDRRRRQPLRGRDVPQGRHDRDRAVDDRGRLASAATSRSPRRCRRCAEVSYDLTLRRPLELADGSTVTALEIQWELFDRAAEVRARSTGSSRVGEEVGARRAAPLGGRAHRRSRPTPCRWPTSSTGSRSTG